MDTNNTLLRHEERKTASEFQDFCIARNLLRRAFQRWLRTEPAAEKVAMEVDGTAGQLRGIAAVSAMRKRRGSC